MLVTVQRGLKPDACDSAAWFECQAVTWDSYLASPSSLFFYQPGSSGATLWELWFSAAGCRVWSGGALVRRLQWGLRTYSSTLLKNAATL